MVLENTLRKLTKNVHNQFIKEFDEYERALQEANKNLALVDKVKGENVLLIE